jgi:hypothetical protein
MTQDQLELLLDYIDYKMIEAVEHSKDIDTSWTESKLGSLRKELFKTITGETN